MQLSEETIKEFQEIYKKKFGEEISDQRALGLGNNLINLLRAIYQSNPSNENQGKLSIEND